MTHRICYELCDPVFDPMSPSNITYNSVDTSTLNTLLWDNFDWNWFQLTKFNLNIIKNNKEKTQPEKAFYQT